MRFGPLLHFSMFSSFIQLAAAHRQAPQQQSFFRPLRRPMFVSAAAHRQAPQPQSISPAASRPMLLRSFRCLRGVNTIRRLNPTIHSSVHPKVQITFYSHFSLYFSTSRSALWSSVALLDVLFVHTIGRCASASSATAIHFSGRFASNAAEELPMSPRHLD